MGRCHSHRGRLHVLAGLLLMASALLWGGAAPSATPAAKPPAARPAGAAAAPGISDAQIDRDLKARLSRSKLAANKFQFRVQGGIVTIEGKTNVIQHKGIATRMAKAAGAKAVVNNIEISENARNKAAAQLKARPKRVEVKQ
jgi:hypothetical protein